jgi:2-methylcitrate dehydratase PrpD
MTARGGQAVYGMIVGEAKVAPRTIVDAQFSVPWTVATALLKGKVTLDSFTPDSIKNQPVVAIARKMSGELDRSMDRHGVGPGRLTITMKDGRQYVEEVEHFLGSVENPMTFEDCAAKFRECAPHAVHPLPPANVDRIIDMIRRLDQLDDVGQITRLLA